MSFSKIKPGKHGYKTALPNTVPCRSFSGHGYSAWAEQGLLCVSLQPAFPYQVPLRNALKELRFHANTGATGRARSVAGVKSLGLRWEVGWNAETPNQSIIAL